MIGDGPMARLCQKIVARAGVGGAVRLTGWCGNHSVRQAMSRHDVYVQHSVTSRRGDMEGWPVSIAEAAGAAMPIVATRHAGIVDQIRNGVEGFLVDPLDWRAMAERMIRLADDPDLRTAMGNAARDRMVQTTVDRQIGLLRGVLNGAGTPPPS